MIRNFNQKDPSIFYPQDKYFDGAKAYGLSDLNDDNSDRQNTATYYAGMDFCAILNQHQKLVDDLCIFRDGQGNLNAYSAPAVPVPAAIQCSEYQYCKHKRCEYECLEYESS